ncbi:helix-turn-helix domain-containing protein [Lacunimicrobium album]
MIKPTNPTRQLRRVALLVLNASDWSRKVHEGIAAFARDTGGWDFWLQPRGLNQEMTIPPTWQGDGAIGRFASAFLRDSVLERNLPAVNISWHGDHTPQMPKVMSDQAACGRLAASFFAQKGFQSFGYVGPQTYLNYQDLVYPQVAALANKPGNRVFRFEPDESRKSPDMDDQREHLVNWIRSLPKPIGIVTWSSIVAREVVVAAVNQHFDVPNDVAVLAIEHDPVLSALSPVPISHVMQRPQAVGYEAAALLSRLMDGEAPPVSPILIEPEGVAEALSTDTAFAGDEIVQKAVSYIKENISSPIGVEDLLKSLHISRRSLEERFRKVLHRSPAEEIRQIRLNELKHLLRNTTLPLSEVTHRCGFAYQEVMIRFFKKATGETPGEYRRATASQVYMPTP